MSIPETYWKDQKGREVRIQFMSDKWLHNIRKYFKPKDGREKIQPIMDEIKRRKLKRQAKIDNLIKMNNDTRTQNRQRNN